MSPPRRASVCPHPQTASSHNVVAPKGTEVIHECMWSTWTDVCKCSQEALQVDLGNRPELSPKGVVFENLTKCSDITNTLVGISGETVPQGRNLRIYYVQKQHLVVWF